MNYQEAVFNIIEERNNKYGRGTSSPIEILEQEYPLKKRDYYRQKEQFVVGISISGEPYLEITREGKEEAYREVFNYIIKNGLKK